MNFPHALAWGAAASLLSALCCAALLPVMVRLATARGWLDHPDRHRTHARAVPRLGGVAILLSTTVALAVLYWAGRSALGGVPVMAWPVEVAPRLFWGAVAVFLVGVADDLRGVSPKTKLLVQLVAALMALSGDLAPKALALGIESAALPLPQPLAALGTILWVVGITNAFNISDGIDGLAGSLALLALGALLLAGPLLGAGNGAVLLLLPLSGAIVPFLRRNWPPARIFLGDAGSMTIGYLLAVLSLSVATNEAGALYHLIPLAALAYPVVDTLTAMARRVILGHPVMHADERHIHHQLLARGVAAQGAVARLVGTSALVVCAAFAVTMAPPVLTAPLVIGAGGGLLLLIGVAFRWLGYMEFTEAAASVRSSLRLLRRRG
jgi:UDP-GlcNAc:undecaprenyl-phosphate GlcNAc-1-phosphate transferase